MSSNFLRVLALGLLASLLPACGGSSGTPFPGYPGAWARTYGGASSDMAATGGALIPVVDGYVLAGRLSNNELGWLLRLTTDGSIAWQKSYGTAGITMASIDTVPAGGLIFCAQTTSFGAGSTDVWVVRLNDDGSLAWQKTYGGSGNDFCRQIRSTSDGGFVVLAGSQTFSGSVRNLWILKLNADGSVAWQKTLINTADQYPGSIRELPGGGYAVSSETSAGTDFGEAALMRLNADGTVAWQRRYGTTANESVYGLTTTTDSGFLLVGYLYPSLTPGPVEAWAVRVDSTGDIVWQKKYGSGTREQFTSCEAQPDGDFLLAGTQGLIGSLGSMAWGVRLNADGSIGWQKTYGGGQAQHADGLSSSPFGGCLLTGSTASFGAGVYDLWALHLDDDGSCGALDVNTAILPVNTTAVATATTYTMADTAVIPANSTVVPADTFYVTIPQVP